MLKEKKLFPHMGDTLPELARQCSGGDHNGPHLHKTLYEGTKNFWRTRENVDVRIIEHIDANAIEIIAFSVDKHEEADRIFLYADKVFKKLDNSELAEKISLKREELSRQRKRVPNDEIKAGLLQDLSVQYVLARLSPSTTTIAPKVNGCDVSSPSTTSDVTKTIPEETEEDNQNEEATSSVVEVLDQTRNGVVELQEGGGRDDDTTSAASMMLEEKRNAPSVVLTCEPRFAIDFVALTGDKKDPKTGFIDVLMPSNPPNDSIEHIQVVRARRKATTKEFNQALRSLRQDSQKLNKAMSDAQRKAGLAVSSIEGFQNFSSRSTYDPTTMSLARWRWIKSIRRVILQNAVAAYTRRLELFTGNNSEGTGDNQVTSEAEVGDRGRDRRDRRVRKSDSTTKLPLLQKKEEVATKRKSMGSLRRIARGSREPRQMDEFTSALSGGIKGRVESHMGGTVLTTGDMIKKYGMKASESVSTLPTMSNR